LGRDDKESLHAQREFELHGIFRTGFGHPGSCCLTRLSKYPILNQMVMYSKQLDLVFGALSDATRRGILEQLAQGETRVGLLAAPYNISQPAVSKHLRVLERAGLVLCVKRGRERYIKVNPKSVSSVKRWINFYSQIWEQQFDAVEDYLKNHGKLNK